MRNFFEIFHRNRLPAGGIVRNGHNHKSDFVSPVLLDGLLHFFNIHVSLEGSAFGRILGNVDNAVDRPGTGQLHMGPGSIEKHV